MDALTTLIQEDATQSMPPFDLWLRGRDDIFTWWFGPGIGCRGSRLVPTVAANGSPAFGQYKPRRRRWLRAVGAPGDRDLGRADRRAHVLPRHERRCSRSSGCPSGSTPSRLVRQHVAQAHEGDELEQLGATRRGGAPRSGGPRGELEPRERVHGHGVGLDPGHLAVGDAGAAPSRRPQTRSHSPGRSARAIGPSIAKVIVLAPGEVITIRPVAPVELIAGRPMSSAPGPV